MVAVCTMLSFLSIITPQLAYANNVSAIEILEEERIDAPWWGKLLIGIFTLGLGLFLFMSDDSVCEVKQDGVTTWSGKCKDLRTSITPLTQKAVCVAESKDRATCYESPTCFYKGYKVNCDVIQKLSKKLINGNVRCNYNNSPWGGELNSLYCYEYKCFKMTGAREDCKNNPTLSGEKCFDEKTRITTICRGGSFSWCCND